MNPLRLGIWLGAICVASLAASGQPDAVNTDNIPTNVPRFRVPRNALADRNVRQVSNDEDAEDVLSLVSRGSKVLPNAHGQVWREYDIRSYTSRVTREKPEQAIVDWILRETGTELWFSEPLGILSVDSETLRVYHTPQIQNAVASVLNRFLSTKTASHAFGMRLITVNSPNWRAKALRMMTPVTVQTPGTEAWLLSKEEAAVLLNDLRQRNGYREHGNPDLLIHNGQQETIEHFSPQRYTRSVIYRQNTWPGYDLNVGEIQEGFSLQLTPLMSPDGRTVDAVIKAKVEQIEKMEEVVVEVPATATQTQWVKIQIPRISGWQLHERFRWPANRVLVISRGVVATPAPAQAKPFFMKNPLAGGRSRGDALLLLECKGPVGVGVARGRPLLRTGAVPRFQGRY